MGRGFPRYQADQTGFKYKYDSNSNREISMGRQEFVQDNYLALKRLKLAVIKGRLKPGRLIYFEDRLSGVSKTSSTSSVGTTCCRSL